jgi:hypothetical protein
VVTAQRINLGCEPTLFTRGGTVYDNLDSPVTYVLGKCGAEEWEEFNEPLPIAVTGNNQKGVSFIHAKGAPCR